MVGSHLGDTDHGRTATRVVDQAIQPSEPGHGMIDHRLDASVRMKLMTGPHFSSNARPSASRRPAATPRAPSVTKISAMRSPMPLVAPVTIATFPSSLPVNDPPTDPTDGITA
jgi:hypothetical protein